MRAVWFKQVPAGSSHSTGSGSGLAHSSRIIVFHSRLGVQANGCALMTRIRLNHYIVILNYCYLTFDMIWYDMIWLEVGVLLVCGTYYSYYRVRSEERAPLMRNVTTSGVVVELRYEPKKRCTMQMLRQWHLHSLGLVLRLRNLERSYVLLPYCSVGSSTRMHNRQRNMRWPNRRKSRHI